MNGYWLRWWLDRLPTPPHHHKWLYEMDGPEGMERDCCEECWARRYRQFGAEVVEDHAGWRKTPPARRIK